MKKIILVLFFLTTIYAQDEITSKWSIYSGITSMGVEDGESRLIGNSYGIAYTVNKRLSIGMGYSGRGSKAKLNRYNAQDTFENLDLVGVPLSGDIEVVANTVEFWSSVILLDKWGFSLWTGPIYSHIYSYYITDVDNDLTLSEDGSEADYGLMFGASFPLHNKIGLNIGYYHGIKDDLNPKFNNLFLDLSYRF
mgnify:FL=1